MSTFTWSDSFLTRLEPVDTEHRHLVLLLNQLGDEIADDSINRESLTRLFDELFEYANRHFRDEEELMKRTGVDPRHVSKHVGLHREFMEDVDLQYQAFLRQPDDTPNLLLDYLIHWLTYHILGTDKNMARQVSAIRAGQSPQAAYESQERVSDPITEPLLIALEGLLDQISSRNRQLEELTRSLERKVEERTREVLEANNRLKILALSDPLTGLANRRHAMTLLADYWKEAVATDASLVCMMIDADNFKDVNDHFGHDAGDQVLIAVARCLQHTVRTDDSVCRLGGDEFLIICPDTGLSGGLYLAEQVRATIADLRVPAGQGSWQAGVSIGVAARTTALTYHEELITLADQGLYLAKQQGRNRVCSVQTTE